MSKPKTYAEKLKDPRWQKRRLEILERDSWTCQDCFSNDNPLTVHHKYYIYQKEPWEYQDELLITLCEDCHKYWEDHKGIITDFTKVLLVEGWSPEQLERLHKIILSIPPGEHAFQCFEHAKEIYDRRMSDFYEVLEMAKQTTGKQ